MKTTAASPNLERLNPFIGVWNTEGEMQTGSNERPARFTAIDTYEWLPGGHFLLHRFDSDMPDGKVQGIEVIGYSQETNSYPMHSFDNSGKATMMQARVEKDIWTFVGEGVRFTGSFRDDGKIFSGMWELRPDEGTAWQPWMNVKLMKIE